MGDQAEEVLEAALATSADRRATATVERRNAAEAERAEGIAAAELADRSTALRDAAASARVPATAEGLTALDRNVDRFAEAASRATGARRTALRTAERAASDQVLADRARAEASERAAEHADHEHESTTARARYDTLVATVGADAEAAMAELTRLDAQLRALKIEAERLDQQRSTVDRALGSATAAVASTASAIERNDAALAAAAGRLPVLRRADLLALVLATTYDAQLATTLPADPVEFAAWLTDRASGTVPDDEAQARAQAALDKAQRPLLDDLSRGYDGAITHDDGVTTVQITADSGTFGLAVLADQLRAKEDELASYLTEGDRQVFERFLLNRVAHELRRLLAQADEFVGDVNAALGGTATASGLRVELDWLLDVDDAGVVEAVRLLRHDTDQMGDDDRARLRAFFDRVIRQQRAADPEAGYRTVLERALDYRAWHRFQPYLRAADGGRAKLNRSRFRELSGGEQAVALHLPLFAAASAHYARALPTAPRLVALDEAFAGIDEAMRGELMALTVLFRLDLILTGHELWGAYAEVPSIAVHDLLRRPPAEGVSVFSLRWDGAALAEGHPEDGPPTGTPAVPMLPATGLFSASAELATESDGADRSTGPPPP